MENVDIISYLDAKFSFPTIDVLNVLLLSNLIVTTVALKIVRSTMIMVVTHASVDFTSLKIDHAGNTRRDV